MRGAGIVTVELVPTAINPADIFTKILSRQVFEKHRKTILNLSDTAPAACGAQEPGRGHSCHSPRVNRAPRFAVRLAVRAGGVAWHS